MRAVVIHNDSLSCEPVLRRMPDGSLLCICQCGDTYEPAPGNRVYCFRSSDNGESWSRPTLLIPDNGLAVYATEMNVIDDTVRVYAVTHSGRFLNMKTFIMESRDSGRTWKNAGQVPYYPGNCFVRGMLRLKNGNILLPIQYYPISPEENARLITESHNIEDPRNQKVIWNADIRHMENNILISADNGRTYSHVHGPEMELGGRTYDGWNWSEPTLAELSDGRIVMLMRRNNTGCLWRSESADGGMTWSQPIKTEIPNPSNKPKLICMPDGRIVLIHTPNGKEGFWNRNPLAVWISDDDMQTWSDRRIIGDPPFAFCYPDGFVEQGHLLFTIETNRHEVLFYDIEL